MIGLSSDYTELVKEYIPKGQKTSLWDQFLTGTSQQYQTLTQQAQDVYAYDISQAYANYKQQQLQLQMNQQLGEGFKRQVGSQLQSQYGSAFSDIKTQEATALGKIGEQYTADILAGQKEFTQLGEQARTFEKLISEYATSINKTLPENAYKTTKDEQTGVITKELTDYVRLWYYEILDDPRFQDWILSEESASDLDLEDREAFYEAYRQNPELYRSVVAGLTSEFDYEETKNRLELEAQTQAIESLTTATNNTRFQDYVKPITTGKTAEQVENVHKKLTSGNAAEKFTKYNFYAGRAEISGNKAVDVVTGETYDKLVQARSPKSNDIIKSIPDMKRRLKEGKLSKGDIITYNGKKYVIASWSTSNMGNLEVDFRYKRS